MSNIKTKLRKLKNSATSSVSSSLASKRFVTRGVWAAKIRKLVQESRRRGDDPTKDSEIVRLTENQLEFIREKLVAPDSGISTVPGAVIIDEPVDVDLLQKAINTVIKNNDAMRLTFVKDEEGIVNQYAAAYKPLEIPLLKFESEEELERYCDLKGEEQIPTNGLVHEINMFQLPDGRGGITIQEDHLRVDAVGIVTFAVYVMDVYEKRKSGKKNYEGARTSFINHARIQQEKNPQGPSTVHVEDSDRIDAASSRIISTLDKEKTSQIKEFCKKTGEECRPQHKTIQVV